VARTAAINSSTTSRTTQRARDRITEGSESFFGGRAIEIGGALQYDGGVGCEEAGMWRVRASVAEGKARFSMFQ
jgi:hypothetical protein